MTYTVSLLSNYLSLIILFLFLNLNYTIIILLLLLVLFCCLSPAPPVGVLIQLQKNYKFNRSDASKIEAVDEVFSGCDEDAVQKMEAARKNTLEQAKQNIVAAQEKHKEIYDKKHCTNPEVYSVGALVLKKNFTQKKRKGEA